MEYFFLNITDWNVNLYWHNVSIIGNLTHSQVCSIMLVKTTQYKSSGISSVSLLRALEIFDMPPVISPELNKCPGSNTVPCKTAHLRCLIFIPEWSRNWSVLDPISTIEASSVVARTTYPWTLLGMDGCMSLLNHLSHMSIPCSKAITEYGQPWMMPLCLTIGSVRPEFVSTWKVESV